MAITLDSWDPVRNIVQSHPWHDTMCRSWGRISNDIWVAVTQLIADQVWDSLGRDAMSRMFDLVSYEMTLVERLGARYV